MSGGLKAGLIFALVSIIAVVGFSFIPAIGVFCCGPVATMALGAIAGYIGVRWSGPTAGIGSGTLAGGSFRDRCAHRVGHFLDRCDPDRAERSGLARSSPQAGSGAAAVFRTDRRRSSQPDRD
jgi:hypothetical protein